MLLNKSIELLKQNLLDKGRSKETIRGYIMDITLLDRFLTEKYNCPTYLEELTEDDIESYLRMLREEKGYQPASINRHLNSIRVLCKFAYKKDLIEKNPSRNVEQLKCQRKERVFLSADELDTLLESIDHRLVQLAVRTMAYTGLRVSECTKLTIDDIDLENDLIHVIAGKGNKDRVVPISGTLKPYLLDYINGWRVNVGSNKFFATKKTGELSHQTINRVLQETTYKLEWKKKVTCHILRHSFASFLVAKNVNVTKISKLLGHADVRTTSVYMHTNTQELKEAVNLL
ncbi:tyrosine-type recombinase/integrase [Metabacillus sp. B2-18]|uniref:tyrosine-type recombinase/integrase n=1 Tax=Metabacillus sp. B2-18 TaxID=2897333 RepID=UPI001E4BDAE3|nr:tyrosine-type recombinase/integrase [Metabacillus sp. B2-18]UGB30583.1 tyrosine-type recombinase/integrase [Metabacillus sp. B2-18]